MCFRVQQKNTTLFKILCFLNMLKNYVGCGDGDIDASEKIVNEMLERYPEASIKLWILIVF